eukprot:5469404-Prymnesium_polylepis.1
MLATISRMPAARWSGSCAAARARPKGRERGGCGQALCARAPLGVPGRLQRAARGSRRADGWTERWGE